jgi:hypothetical protein
MKTRKPAILTPEQKARHNALTRAWYQANKLRKRAQVYAWRKADPEPHRAAVRRHQAKKKAAKEAV